MKLSAKDILGNKTGLSNWQTKYHAFMSARYPDLERGISSLITKRKHLPVWLFKQAAALDKSSSEVAKALNGINPLNAGKKKDEAIALLSDWLPEAVKFTAQIETVNKHISELEKGIADVRKGKTEIVESLRGVIDSKDDEILKYQAKLFVLKERMQIQESLIKKIPPEIIEQVKLSEERKKELER